MLLFVFGTKHTLHTLTKLFLLGASHRLQERSVPATQTSVLLNDLQPGTTYLLRVVAENDVGRGESSEPFKLRTEEEGIQKATRMLILKRSLMLCSACSNDSSQNDISGGIS